jgi:D-sedoheptulose 7-phosphate isomerase
MHTITAYLEKLRLLVELLPAQQLEEFVAVLLVARELGNRVFFMGNGGSGSTASHFATDLGKGTAAPGTPRFKVLPLNDQQSTFSAYANDMGYETVFAEQMRAFIERGDIVIGLSTSGKSRNVLQGMTLARAAGGVCVAMTGFDGGPLAAMADLNLHIPENHTGRVEDAHHIMMHLVCDCIRTRPPDLQYPLPAWAVRETWGLRVNRTA